MNIAKEISNFVTQEFSTKRYKKFISYVFSNGEGFEFQIEEFKDPEENFAYIKKEYCLLPEPLNLGNFQKLQFYVFEVDSVNAKIGLYKELKKRLETIDSSAVLACFYQEGNPTFRLSLITRSLNENGGIDYSNPKRQSFVLGNTNKTALLKFNELAKNIKTSSKLLEALTQAFSVENVTKEFYNEIVKSFEDFAKEIEFPTKQDETHIRQFILRMFSRILFCKFLEKKEVISPEIWDTQLSENYYHNVLEPLFFQTLNTEKEYRDYGWIDSEIQNLLSDIPYLNGGLFAPQEGDFFDPKNPTVHINDLIIPNSLFNDLFETLETFHFTIDESTPLDQEVGLDPEMLGMVFENLLSVLFTDNKVDKLNSLRKKTGSYYTPREIVSYMVKSSILEYLTDKTNLDKTQLKALIFDCSSSFECEDALDIMKALLRFKVLDPACGSGAFPMGMLQEICSILEVLDPQAKAFFNLQSSTFKEENEGKDPTYIRKLSILQNNIYGVDIQPMAIEISRLRCFLSLICEEDKDHIAPLPNLEFKFITANSLISMPKNDNVLIHDAYSTIRKIMEQYFTSSDKEELQKKYREAQKIIAKEYEFSPLADYDPFDPQSVAGFFDSEIMFEVKEFDCVIGNPPYKQVYKGIFDKKIYPYSEQKDKGKQNLYKVFVEFAFNAIKHKGNLSLITQSSLMADTSAKYTRELLLTKTKIMQCIEFPKKTSNRQDKVFASVLQGTCIISAKKNIPNHTYKFSLSVGNDKKSIGNLVFEKIEQASILKLFKENFEFPLIRQGEMAIVKKVKNLQNKIQTFSEETLQGNINTKYLKEIQTNQNSSDKVIKILKGANCKRFWIDKDNIKLSLANNPLVSKAIKKNLKKHIVVTQNITGTTDPYRIIATYTCNETFVFLDTINMIYCKSDNDAKLIVGILNSMLIDWLFRKTSTNNHVNLYELENLPIPQITESNQPIADKIIIFVGEILKAKEQNPQANTSAQEDKIDELVYQLYNLTSEEIAIIEGK